MHAFVTPWTIPAVEELRHWINKATVSASTYIKEGTEVILLWSQFAATEFFPGMPVSRHR